VSSPAQTGVARVLDTDATDLFGLTAALCAVPSVSGDETALADAVERRLRERAPNLAIERIANNVVARTTGAEHRRVVLGGHLDTVPAAGNATPRVERDTLFGLGSADMKGGIAGLLALAERASATPGRFECTFVFYEGEEVADEHNGLRHLFAEVPTLVAGDLAILLEPTAGWVEAGCQGTISVRATWRGVRAHTARPWMGENAIHRAAPTLAALATYEPGIVDVEGLAYREALQVVRVEGGVANNVVPDGCAVVVNRRYAPSRPLDAATAEVRALLADADDVSVLNASPAAPPHLGAALVAEFVGTLDLAVRPKLGWTDVARFAAAGIPALNFGPGDPEIAHTADERVERADVEGCYRVLAYFLGLERFERLERLRSAGAR
jgi:succinyl-diaminopimelate desuccinylase